MRGGKYPWRNRRKHESWVMQGFKSRDPGESQSSQRQSPSTMRRLEVNSPELMDSSSLWTLSFLFVSCSPVEGQHQMIGSSQPIIAAPGDDVILPCHLDPPLDVQRFIVEWSRPDLKPDPSDPLRWVDYVHLYRYSREVLKRKIPSFVNRTKLFTEELKRGNISLKVLNVTSADEGRYRCFIPNLMKHSIIELVVDPDYKTQTTETPLLPKDLQTPDPGVMMNGEVDGTRHIAWILPLCVVLCLAAGVGGFFIKQRCQKQNDVKYDLAPSKLLPA